MCHKKNNLTSTLSRIKVGLFNARSRKNKLTYIAETLREFNLDILCLTETCLFYSDICIYVVRADLSNSYSRVAVVHSSNIRDVPNDFEVSSFELMEATFNHHREAFKIVIVYWPGYPDTEHDFMEGFGFLLEDLLAKNVRLVILTIGWIIF